MTIFAVFIGLAVVLLILRQAGALSGAPPTDLGVKDGKLKPPSTRPNSVSSQTTLHPGHPRAAYAAIEPLHYSGSGAAALQKVAGILRGMERTVIVTEQPGYLYAQCTTKLLRFTDDIEFALDEAAGVIHVRSASRLGESDLGVNRARVESIRQALTTSGG